MNDFYSKLESEIKFYLNENIEISDGVEFSQHDVIERTMKFKNRDLSGTKIDDDLRYLYHFDIIKPRVENEVKNLRIDTKHIMPFSEAPRQDFAAVFIMESKLDEWMEENDEAEKLNKSVEEFSSNGNVGFKKTKDGFERVDPLNTYITNQTAETVEDTDIIERHQMTANELRKMKNKHWNETAVDEVIENLSGKEFQSTKDTTDESTTKEYYEIYEFTGEVNESQYNDVTGKKGGDEDEHFLAKIIVAGLDESGKEEKYTLYHEKLKGDTMKDWYRYAHRGEYNGRFWRVGMYELLFDHQVRANEIARDIAQGLEWASKVVFKSGDNKVLQNIRSDLVNGDIIITEDLQQVDVRLRNMDQLINDWNRLIQDADSLAHSHEISRGESLPSGTPFRLGALLNENMKKVFTLLRQKFAITYRSVFENWMLDRFVDDLSGEDIFRLTGDNEMLDRFRKIRVDSWYMNNLVQIGPHTEEAAKALKAEKLDEMRNSDPVIENAEEIWDDVLDRLRITIVGENKEISDQMKTIGNLIQLEQDPQRRQFLLDSIYKIKGIPVPPKENERTPNRNAQQQQRQRQTPKKTKQGGEQTRALKQLRENIGNNNEQEQGKIGE